MTGYSARRMPIDASGYHLYLSEYERLRKVHKEETEKGNEVGASIVEYESECLKAKMQMIEKALGERFEELESDPSVDPRIISEMRVFMLYRYVKGYSVEKTAEMMNVSRSTAYRIGARLKRMVYGMK